MTEAPSTVPSQAPRKVSFLVAGLIVLAVLALVLGGLWWWHNRPIQPVNLSPQEKSVVEAKVEAIRNPQEPKYEKGSKEIILTERELNGLLNENTKLGKSLSFQLARDAIHARVETDIDPDLPLIGGKHLKARARFLVAGGQGKPQLALDDVTLWGISLPNDWLGGLKGQDLFGTILGGDGGGVPGVEEFRIDPGRMTIHLAE